MMGAPGAGSGELNRREALRAIATLPLAVARKASPSGAATTTTIPPPPVVLANGLAVAPRSAWARPSWKPTGLRLETTVNVIVVHHSETPNAYGPADVPGRLRSMRAYHVSPKKGWPDLAYNFAVDRFGGVWEGRAGSLAGPVRGDASDGNQGHSQLVCLIGDHRTEAPTDAATVALVLLLEHLTRTYGLSGDPAATTTFVSEGSSRWAAGETITSHSIEGHRALSLTTCPGNAAFGLLPGIRLAVHRERAKYP